MKRNLSFTLLFILGFFILFFPNWAIQAVALPALGTVVISYVYSAIQYTNVAVYRKEPVLRAHRRQNLPVEIVVENRGRMPLYFLFVRDLTGRLFANEEPVFSFSLEPGERRTVGYSVECRERGFFALGPVTIRGADPLGFFPWEKRPGGTTRVIIYPRVLPVSLENRAGLPAGNLKSENR